MMKANRMIAMCDVLGFSYFVQSEPLDSLVSRYEQLIKRTTYETRLKVTTFGKEGEEDRPFRVDYRVFSDTILLWSEPITDSDEQSFLNTALFVQTVSRLVAASIAKALPLRIGLAYGECHVSPTDEIYVGQPIVDAYLTEQRQDWIGAACHPSCLATPFGSELATMSDYQMHGGIVAAEIPVWKTRKGPDLHYTLDWPYFIPKGVDRMQLEHLLESGRAAFADNRRASRKWSRGLKFFRERRRVHESGRLSIGGMITDLLELSEKGNPEEKARLQKALSTMNSIFAAMSAERREED